MLQFQTHIFDVREKDWSQYKLRLIQAPPTEHQRKKLECDHEKAAVAYFKSLSRHSPEETEQTK